MDEIEGTHEGRLGPELGELVEHEDPPTPPIRSHLEARAAGRERVVSGRPRTVFGDRGGCRIVIAVVEDDREQPVVARPGYAIAVADAFEVPGRAARLPMDLSHGRRDPHEVLELVLVDDDVALVVEALIEQPAEDAALVGRVGDPRRGRPTVDRGHVARRDDPPVGLAVGVRPPLDSSERPLGPGPIATDLMCALDPLVADPAVAGVDQRRDEFVLAGQHERVAVGRVVVGR